MKPPACDTILIVEDDLGIAELEMSKLEQAGYHAVIAATPEDAMRQLQAHPVVLILLDYRLSATVDGIDFYNQLKDTGLDLPVILVTGFSDERIAIKALRAGVRDFITKSTEFLDFLPDAVERVLSQLRMEKELARSEARLAAIIESAKDAIIIVEADQRISLFNPAAEKMFRCAAAEALGESIQRFVPKELNPSDPDICLDVAAAESLTMLLRYGSLGVRADGTSFPLEASVSRGRIGERKFYTLVVRDITERRRFEERMEEQAALLDKANDAIVVRDLDDRIRFWNHGAERLYGWTAVEAMGRGAAELLDKPLCAELDEAQRALETRGEWTGELRQTTKDGKDVIVASRWTVVRDRSGTAKSKLIINTDVTEKRKLEAQYLHAQRMESIGTLAGGVAHDFNNLLTVISGYSEILMNKLPPEDPCSELIREIRKASERASVLTRQLLAFSRKQILSLQILDLNHLVREMERMLLRLIGEDVHLAVSLAPRLGKVKADPGQVEQVIVNLAVNARDAMPTGGQLTIETQNVELDESYTQRYSGLRPGSYAMLAVSDTGCGMDAETQAHIFEPFFTTKEVGKGTGLGLATVYGIIKQSNGHIDVYSEPGVGTTFKLFLPRVEAAPSAAPAPAPARTAAPLGTETVLLAEDEDGVRSLARMTLQASGYRVVEARDGAEAFQIGQQHPGPIDLLVTDVVMPKLSGRQLAERLAPLRPNLKVLFLSGYTGDAIVRHGVPEKGRAFMQKPFTPIALAQRVREVLDQ